MAGHSKWANIQHRKGRQDEKRARLFSRLVREVAVAARFGGGDPSGNARLRAAMDAAVAANIPRDTVQRAIDRSIGNDADANNIEEVRYEGYGPAGVAFIVDCQTDNRNRTVGEVRHAFVKSGGNLGTGGSVVHLFRSCAVFGFAQGSDHEALFECVAEAGAEDLAENDDGGIDIVATVAAYDSIKKALQSGGFTPEHSIVTMRPHSYAQLDEDAAVAVASLLDKLESIDDVQNVYCNAEPQAIAANGNS